MSVIVCRNCRVPPKIVTLSRGDQRAVCMSCGLSDSVEDAVRIAHLYLALGPTVPTSKSGGAAEVAKRHRRASDFRWHAAL